MSDLASEPRRIAGRYVVRAVLGRGGMGTVFRADDDVLGRQVAIKEVPVPDAVPAEERAAARARVLREARAAARIDHHGVVTVHDVIDEPGRVHIVMELVAAPTLAQLVGTGGPLPPARAAALGRQVLDVLERAHAAGIVHRDVKPANVMVLPGDRVKVADFGIAAVRGDPTLTAAGTVLGSPSYMAPEQASGLPVGPQADLWALGATLYYAVEGRPPFRGDDPREVLTAILVGEPEPTVLAGPLAPVLTALLGRRPDDRPDATRLRAMLDEVAASAPPARLDTPIGLGAGGTGATVPSSGAGETAPSPRVAETVTSAPTPVAPDGGATEPVGTGWSPAGAPGLGTERQSTGWSPAGGGERVGPPPVPAAPGSAGVPGWPGGARVAYPPVVVEDPTRRRLLLVLLGGGGLVAILLLVALVLTVIRPDDPSTAQGPRTGGPSAAPTGASAARTGASAVQNGAPSSPGAGSPRASGAVPPTAGPASGSGGTGSVAEPGGGSPTQLQLATVAPNGQVLPRFWASGTNSTGGYRIGVPSNLWQVTAEGTSTYAEWPGGATFEAAFEVQQYPSTQDPYALLRARSAAFAKAHASDRYAQVELDPTWTYRRGPAAAWEYTWVRNGELTRARVVAFRAGAHTYTVLYRSKDLWWNGGGTSRFPTGFETAFTPLG